MNSRDPRGPMYYIAVYSAVSVYQLFEGPQSHIIILRSGHWCWFVSMLRLLQDCFLFA